MLSRKEFEDLVIKAFGELPEEFKNKLENIEIVIEQKPNNNITRSLRLKHNNDLLGLYQGIPLKDRTHYYGMVLPDKITLYKENIEEASRREQVDIYKKIKHILQHEIAHYFGITDQRLGEQGIY